MKIGEGRENFSAHTAPTIFPTYSFGFKKPKTMKLFYLLMIKFG